MLKLYMWVMLCLVLGSLSIGFVLPYLFSAAHTELVLLGVGYLVVFPVVIFYIINSKIKPIVKEMIEKATKGEI